MTIKQVLLVPVACVAALAAAQDAGRVERMIEDDTNTFRREEGLPRVKASPKLERAARHFVEYMAQTDRYGHTVDGKKPHERAQAAGYDYCLVAENIAYQYSSTGFRTPELAHGLFEGWKKSPGHRRNMLEPDALDTAVAVARSPHTGRWYAVQMFGRPRSSPADCARGR